VRFLFEAGSARCYRWRALNAALDCFDFELSTCCVITSIWFSRLSVCMRRCFCHLGFSFFAFRQRGSCNYTLGPALPTVQDLAQYHRASGTFWSIFQMILSNSFIWAFIPFHLHWTINMIIGHVNSNLASYFQPNHSISTFFGQDFIPYFAPSDQLETVSAILSCLGPAISSLCWL